jgi:hypothetical protein
MELDHETSEMDQDGVFRVGFLHHRIMRYWIQIDLQVDRFRLIDFPQQLRSMYFVGNAGKTTEYAAASDNVGGDTESQPHHEADTGEARHRLTFDQREELAWIAYDLVCLGAIAAGPLPFGGERRVSCTLQRPRHDEVVVPIFKERPNAEIFVTRLSLPHEPLRFAIAADAGIEDPVIWTFEIEGRALAHCTHQV